MQIERITGPVAEQTEIAALVVERMAARDGVFSIDELQAIRETRLAAKLADEADSTVGCAFSMLRRDGIRGQQFRKRFRALQQDIARLDSDPEPDGPAGMKKAA